MDDATATSLARRFRAGDRSCLGALVEGLARTLLALAYRYTQDWEIARDLCQETWLRVHERIHTYDPGRPFRPWLLVLHRNGCLGWLRRAARSRETSLPADRIARLAPPAGGPAPDAALEDREFGERVRAAAAALPDRQREVFLRVDLEQGEQREVAEELNMNFTTLRTTLRLARLKVAARLREEEETP